MDAFVVIGLCVLGIVLGNIQNGAHLNQRVNRVDSTVRLLIMPLAVPMSGATRAVSEFFRGTLSARNLAAENAHLKDLLKHLDLYDSEIEERDNEIKRLRVLQGFLPVPGKTRVPASVCGFSISENRLTLNVGSKQGVKLGCPVECADGLVGTVEEVEATQCQVLLLTSAGLQPTSNGKVLGIGAVDNSRNPPLIGMVRGENASTLSMTFLDPKAPAQIGDLVVTSGFSDTIPPGLVIGKIIQTEPNEELGTLKGRLSPSFEPGDLDAVFVLI